MKDTRKELFHTYVEVKTEKISYPYLEKYKVREADADIIEGQKRAADHYKKVSGSVLKRFLTLGILGFFITLLFVAFGSVIYDTDTKIIIMLLGALIGTVLSLSSFVRFIKERKSEEYIGAKDKLDSFDNAIAFNLGAPTDAKTIDLIVPVQKKKLDGSLGFSVLRKNLTYKIFKKGEDVYVIANNYLFLIPKNDIVLFTVEPKAMPFQNWDKKESYTSERYKPYKIGYNTQSYTYFVKNTSEIVFRIEGEDYKTVVMPWSTSEVEQIFNKKAYVPPKKEKKK
jgi:hypothetical protein